MKKFGARCAGSTDPQKLSGSLLYALERGEKTSITVIGANALQQAVKAVIILSGSLAQRGISVAVRPSFTTTTITSEDEGDEDTARTAILLQIQTTEP
jgi:stage V sporulation protein SpoVS